MSTVFACDTCFDSCTIDQGGREIACPDCGDKVVTFKITGLSHGLGLEGINYLTATGWSSSTITFVGTPRAIKLDVTEQRRSAVLQAQNAGYVGRNRISSGAIAIAKMVIVALNNLTKEITS